VSVTSQSESGRVLVVDDEIRQLEMLKAILER